MKYALPLLGAWRSMQRETARARRLGYIKHAWFKAGQRRYATACIVRARGGFMLAYEGEASTGPFKTRQKAADWFLKGGR